MFTKWTKVTTHLSFFLSFSPLWNLWLYAYKLQKWINLLSKWFLCLFRSSASTTVWKWKWFFFVPSLLWHQQCYFYTLSHRLYFCSTRSVLMTELLVLLHSSQETGTATMGLAVKQEFSVNCPRNHRCWLKLRYSWIRMEHSLAKMPSKWIGRGKW